MTDITPKGDVLNSEEPASGSVEQEVGPGDEVSSENVPAETEISEPSKNKRPGRQRVLKRLRNLLLKIFVIGLLLWILLNYVGGVFICHTNDMYPALRDGDLVITFRLGGYKSGDLVIYEHEGKNCFGRIVGEPGDEVVIDEEGTYTINGLRPYETIYYETKKRPSDTMVFPYTVKEGEYFVLADAREQAMDSRSIGPVTKLKGKVIFQIRRRGF